MMDIESIADYVNANTENIANQVNDNFSKSKEFIRAAILRRIRKSLQKHPVHYVWQYDGCPYDYSGELVADGYISLDQTINSLLENEYTGNKEATYESGYGFRYFTFGDELAYMTNELAYSILNNTVWKIIEERFSVILSEDDFDNIRRECNELDDIYDICMANDFFDYEEAIRFVGIGEMTLAQL